MSRHDFVNAVVAAFNQEKALVWAVSMIVKLREGSFLTLVRNNSGVLRIRVLLNTPDPHIFLH